VCNLYSLTRSQEAMRRLFAIKRDLTGNLASMPAIYPDMLAPVVRIAKDGERQLEMMRWGFPPPPNLGARPVSNVRNVKSPYWRPWLKPEFRCLAPASSFCEWTDGAPKTPHWFALRGQEPRPLFAFAGVWRPWTGERKGVSGEHLLFSFLTTDANDVVRPVHAKAMPVMLTESMWDAWLSEPTEKALELHRPAPPENMGICLRGATTDAGTDV